MDALIMRPSLVRQPGSTLKPIAVYTPALEQGYEISDILVDEPININGYSPQNFDRQYRGQVTMYDAVVNRIIFLPSGSCMKSELKMVCAP